jgi:ParB family chromosome partitioning protein
MNISKKDMAARASRAAQSSPSIEDRLRQARDLVASHPVDESVSVQEPVRQNAVTAIPAGQETAASSGTRLAIVALDLIDQNPYNARKIYRPERVNDLAASIAAHGQEIPGIATIRNGRYVLAAGHYRLRALKVLSKETMTLMIHEGLSDRELYAHSYRENAEREGQSSLDNALSWRELIDQGVYANETEIAEATGMSLPNVNKTLAALRLSPPVLDVVKEDPTRFGLSSLYELALYESAAGQAKAILIARLVKAGDAGRKEIQEARGKVENFSERKRKETSRQYKIQSDGIQIGLLKEWDSGKVAFEVLLADPKDRAALVAELRARFGLIK